MFPEDSRPFIEASLKNTDFDSIYKSIRSDEIESKDILVGFEKNYPNIANSSNLNDILKNLKKKQ